MIDTTKRWSIQLKDEEAEMIAISYCTQVPRNSTQKMLWQWDGDLGTGTLGRVFRVRDAGMRRDVRSGEDKNMDIDEFFWSH